MVLELVAMEPEEYALMAEVEGKHWWFTSLRKHVLAQLGDRLGDGARVLDAGCGTGGTLVALYGRFPSAKIIGIDFSREAISYAKQKAASQVAFGNVVDLPFPDSTFDAVISLDVICHESVAEKRALGEFFRVVKPGGVVVIDLPA